MSRLSVSDSDQQHILRRDINAWQTSNFTSHYPPPATGLKTSQVRDGISSPNAFFCHECIRLFLAITQNFNTYNPWLKKLHSLITCSSKTCDCHLFWTLAQYLIWCYYFYWREQIKCSLHIFSMLLSSKIPLSYFCPLFLSITQQWSLYII